MSLDQRFSWRLKALREAQGLTQDKLSEQSTVSAQTISFVECGRSSPSLATAELLVHGLGFENLEAFLCAPIPEKHPILEDIPEDCEYYLCGPPMMAKTVLDLLWCDYSRMCSEWLSRSSIVFLIWS